MDDRACDCCEGTHVWTPVAITNRPGLSALAYRVGTHARFFETLKAKLSSQIIEPSPLTKAAGAASSEPMYPLRNLATRAPDDASIAMLDCWATVADVLTFYQERIANEGYLRTATERRSVLELARLVDYRLRPGVASSVYLAYTIDEKQTTPAEIPIGTRSQSIPNPGEQAQTFETSEVLDARANWNVLKPRLTQPQTIESIEASRTLYLKGVGVNVKPNDPLLIVLGTNSVFVRVKSVLADTKNDRTAITVQTVDKSAAPPAVVIPPKPAPAMKVDVARGLRDVSARYRNAADFKVDSKSEMAGRVIKVLDDLQASATTETPIDQLEPLMRGKYLPQIEAELATATGAGYVRLKSWLTDMVAALETAMNEAREAALAAAHTPTIESPSPVEERIDLEHGAPDIGNGSGSYGEEPRSTDDLLDVIVGLSRPPSVPPANTLRLERSVRQSFARDNDSGLQVVNAIRPDFKAILPVALTNTQVTSTNALEVYALRLKTGVYGNTAPLKPITDHQGKVIGTQEWPLNGNKTIGVALGIGDISGNSLSGNATITVVSAGATATLNVDLARDKDTLAPLNEVNFVFQATDRFPKDDYTVTYTDKTGNTRLAYQRNTLNNTIEVTIVTNGKPADPISLAFGQTVTATLQAHSWKLEYYMDDFENIVLAITDEAPLPPSPLDVIALDAAFDTIAPQTYYVIQRPNHQDVMGQIRAVQTVGKTAYNFPAKVTELTLDKNWLDQSTDRLLSDIRSTSVFVQSEPLELAEEPIDPIKYGVCGGKGNEIELDGLYSDLKSGRWLIVTGARSDIADTRGNVVNELDTAELAMLASVRHGLRQDENGRDVNLPGDKTHTFITLDTKLAYCYRRDKAIIYGNVVKATHGETRNEILGNGDGSRALQSFDLKQPPLTYVAAPNPSGVDSTLKVYVNDVEWHESTDLVSLDRTAHNFITRTNDDGKTTLVFGDGQHGARVPTGAANVRAEYRNGIGKGGNVQARQISLLVSRPLGVKEVINPLRASGGADKETRDQARKNVPLAVTALDRLVSVQDYADFARTFAGIAKASAQRLSSGQRELVHLTIAGVDDVPIDPSSDLYRNLALALRRYGDPDLGLQIDLRESLTLVIDARVYLKADYIWEKVVSDVRTKLLDAFSFDRRELGQDALLSEAISVTQAVPGVAYVDVDIFGAIPEKMKDSTLSDPTLKGRRLLTPTEITAFVQRMTKRRPRRKPDDMPGNLEYVDGYRFPLPVLWQQLLYGQQPLDRISVDLANLEDGQLRPAQLAFLSPLVPDTLVLNRGRND